MLKASYTLNGELTQFQGQNGMEKMKNFQTVYEYLEVCTHMDILYNQGRYTINKFSDNDFFLLYFCVCVWKLILVLNLSLQKWDLSIWT